MADRRLSRADRRAKGKKLGIKIEGTNKPVISDKVITSKKSKWNPYNIRKNERT